MYKRRFSQNSFAFLMSDRTSASVALVGLSSHENISPSWLLKRMRSILTFFSFWSIFFVFLKYLMVVAWHSVLQKQIRRQVLVYLLDLELLILSTFSLHNTDQT